MLRVLNSVADRVWFAVPPSTKWESIGNQTDAAFIFVRTDFVFGHY